MQALTLVYCLTRSAPGTDGPFGHASQTTSPITTAQIVQAAIISLSR